MFPARSVHKCVNEFAAFLASAVLPLRAFQVWKGAGCGKKISQLPPFETTVLPAQKGDSLEADEMWSFVAKKKNKKWVYIHAGMNWLIVSWRTRQVIAYAVGDRSAETCRLLWHRVPRSYRRKLIY